MALQFGNSGWLINKVETDLEEGRREPVRCCVCGLPGYTSQGRLSMDYHAHVHYGCEPGLSRERLVKEGIAPDTVGV